MLKALDIWMPAYLRHPKRKPVPGVTHVLLAVCDHFEPFHLTDWTEALERVDQWRIDFPRFSEFRDADGASPKQTFFYPVEQYHDRVLEHLAEVCRLTGCETELHLHHHDDTAENLAATLEQGKGNLVKHGLLSRDPAGAVRFGFIHGNWALDDSHPKGQYCGVRHELRILQQAGCFADFTLPSAPGRTQTRTINSLYYATSTGNPKSHDTGVPVRVGTPPSGDMLMMQGPLGLNWQWRKLGILPRIENSDLTAVNPPTLDRFKLWFDLNIHVDGRPEWVFIKLHTHGAPPPNRDMLLGEPMRQFHSALSQWIAEQNGAVALHYVSAREMVNILHAAEDGKTGTPGDFRDYQFRSNIVCS